MHIVVTENNRAGGTAPLHFMFNKDVVLIGRARAHVDLVLNDDRVSRLHVKLKADRIAGTITVEDCGSSLGTFIDDKDIGNENIVLQSPETKIRIDPFIVTAHTDLFSLPVDEEVEQGFLSALRVAANDDTTRAVYADWLEEQGRHKESKFLRAQLVVREVEHPSDPKFQRASKQLVDLSKTISAGWRARVAMTFIESATCSRSKSGRWPQEGLAFDLECPKRWDEMKPTAFDGLRHCSVCNENVTYCTSITQAQMLAAEGKCVAVDAGVPRHSEDLLDPRTLIRGRAAPPRVYLGAASYVDGREQEERDDR